MAVHATVRYQSDEMDRTVTHCDVSASTTALLTLPGLAPKPSRITNRTGLRGTPEIFKPVALSNVVRHLLVGNLCFRERFGALPLRVRIGTSLAGCS